MKDINRRAFLEVGAVAACALTASPVLGRIRFDDPELNHLFDISLAQWSLHRRLRAGELDALDFAKITREAFEIGAIEYVNSFFKDKADDEAYLKQLKTRAEEHDVKSLLIMIDGEGALGDPDKQSRLQAITNHEKWVRAAQFLGCHSIRVNAQSRGAADEQHRLVVDGLSRLCDYADPFEINVIVENHGGLSSNGAWLAAVMKDVDHERCGTLPDFGNFRIQGDEWYDRYQGVEELMPYAKAVSAKSHDFDDDGNETRTDFLKMMRIVLDAGYEGHVGIEYEGSKVGEMEGIMLTRRLLERVRTTLTEERAAADG